jgi:hypothetical protein
VELLAEIHSLMRWPVLLAGLATAIKYAVSLARRDAFQRADRVLGAVYAGLLDLQALLGLGLLVGLAAQGGGLPPSEALLHGLAMFFAVAAAHQTARWRDEPDARRFRNGLIAYGLSLALIAAGVAVIVQPA